MVPVNRTGIMQNELLGAGFALDNIGRIVAAPGKYNTPEGIMAGYNLAAREQDFADPKNVFNKRDTNIRNTLKNKYKLDDQQIDQVLSEMQKYCFPGGGLYSLGVHVVQYSQNKYTLFDFIEGGMSRAISPSF